MKNKTMKINLPFILLIILIAIIGGVLGQLLTRAYIFNDVYSGAFSGELNLNDYNRSSLVIRDAKKVVVNQDVQVKESADQIRESMLTIFKVKSSTKAQNIDLSEEDDSVKIPDLNGFYQLNNPDTVALIVSVDGWAIINKDDLGASDNLITNFIAINSDRVIYEIDKQINIKDKPLALIHLSEASNLKPVSFMPLQDLSSGQSLLVLNSHKQIISNFLDLEQDDELVKNSDDFISTIQIYPQMKDVILKPWLFNFKGQAVAVLEDGKWIPLSNYELAIHNALLEPNQTEVELASLGINYIDLSNTAYLKANNKEGALIYKNSQGVAVLEGSNAMEAGLKAGDIILAINSLNLNKNLNLSEALFQFKKGEVVDLTVLRNDLLQIISIEL
jgi:hypothetical protein